MFNSIRRIATATSSTSSHSKGFDRLIYHGHQEAPSTTLKVMMRPLKLQWPKFVDSISNRRELSRWCTSGQTKFSNQFFVETSEDILSRYISMQRGLVLNVSTIFRLVKPAFFRYNENLHCFLSVYTFI